MRRKEAITAILVVIAFVVGAIESPYFLDWQYLLNTSSLYIEAGLLALGMTLVIVSGNIDLSVASMLALVACVTAKLLSVWPMPLALTAGVVLGVLLGTFNGLLVAKMRLPSFVVTLATMAAYRGVAQVMLGAESQRIPASLVGIDYLKVPGTPVPLPIGILIVAAVVVALVLHRTVFGRWVFAVGTNERAAFLSGVPTDRVKILVFAITGLLAGIAGLMIDSRLGVARFDHARGVEVDVIAAVVLGGASIYGGQGSVLGSMLALLLIFLIRTGMGVANVTSEYQLAAIGTLLVLAVLLGNISENLVGSRKASPKPQTP